MTPFQQYIVAAAVLYALDTGFIKNSGNKKGMETEFQKFFDHLTIDTPIKSGQCNALVKGKYPIDTLAFRPGSPRLSSAALDSLHTMEHFGKIMKMVRQTAGLTQQEMADLMNVSKAYISFLESGKKEPNLSFIKRFATEFDVPILLLLWDDFNDIDQKNLNPKLKNLMDEVVTLLKVHFFDQISKRHAKKS